MDNYKLKHKDRSPEETVEFIKDFFDELDIKTEEEWVDENEIGTYSLRLSIEGAQAVGSNGKGMTKKFAKASAYAEFMERLQNMRMATNPFYWRVYEKNGGFFFHESEKVLSAEELVDDNSPFIRMFFEKRGMKNASREEKINRLLGVQQLDYKMLKEFNSFLCVPFYSVRDDRVFYIPYFIFSLYYGSNGMCAGNSLEEAVVQGISELYERNANTRIMKEYISLPDIPESAIAKYEDVYKMYKTVKEDKNFKMLIKDASFGGQFPVVVLVLIENNTGYFGVKLGAHPDFGIALERVFTEATQGISLKMFCHKRKLSFHNEEVAHRENLINSFRTSDAQYPYQLILEPPKYSFFEFDNVSEMTNGEILEAELNKILAQGQDVLIGDFSYTGFGSYHVVIPGISEMNDIDDEDVKKMLQKYNSEYLLGHPELLTPELCEKMMRTVCAASGRVMENTMSGFSGINSSYPYPAKEVYLDSYYFVAVCALSLGRYKTASDWMGQIVECLRERKSDNKADYIFIQKYADGMDVLGDHDNVIKYLRNMFDDEICSKYDELFKDKEDIIKKIYPQIWLDSPYAEQFRKHEELVLKFKEYQRSHPIDLMESMERIRHMVYAEEMCR